MLGPDIGLAVSCPLLREHAPEKSLQLVKVLVRDPSVERGGTGGFAADAPDDGALVAAHLAGDPAAFDALYQRFHPRLVRYLRMRTGQAGAAEDLAHEAFIRALTHLEGFDTARPLWPWLKTIALHAAVDWGRQQSRQQQLADRLGAEPQMPEADAALHLEDVELLDAALSRVPDRQRAALTRCYLQGYKPVEAASEFGVNRNAFEQLLHRARRNLRREYLAQQGAGAPAAAAMGLLPLLAVFRRMAVKTSAVAQELALRAQKLSVSDLVAGTLVAAAVTTATVVAPVGQGEGGGGPARARPAITVDLGQQAGAVDAAPAVPADASLAPRTPSGPTAPAVGGGGDAAVPQRPEGADGIAGVAGFEQPQPSREQPEAPAGQALPVDSTLESTAGAPQLAPPLVEDVPEVGAPGADGVGNGVGNVPLPPAGDSGAEAGGVDDVPMPPPADPGPPSGDGRGEAEVPAVPVVAGPEADCSGDSVGCEVTDLLVS